MPTTIRKPMPRLSLTAAERATIAEILAEPVEFMDHPDFHKAGAEKRIFDDAPAVPLPDVGWYRPLMDDVTGKAEAQPRRASSVLLTGAQERVIFMQFNFARWRMSVLRKRIGARVPDAATAHELLRWHRTAKRLREQIAETNLALVLAMAKRVRIGENEFGDLISEGNMALMRSVDKFDCGRGFKFSTYACRAILKAFSRHGIKLAKHKQRFPTEFDPELERSNHSEMRRETARQESAAELRFIVESNRAELSDVEREVIEQRFGLDRPFIDRQPTLEQVGRTMGVTKERVRQIQNRALEKIRLAIEGVKHPSEVVDARASVN